ncbi:hypothetical protein E1H12_16250 [Geitlerinema sp. P-1104]|nr:hypothetical protein [Geitlerinema sp. P-1104]
METFAVGTACCWTSHKFVAGEQGIKCLTCGKVMTNSAWEEKSQCRCSSTNIVPAIASNSTSSLCLGNSRSSSNPPSQTTPEISRSTLPRPRPISSPRPRRQLNWRDSPPPVPLPRSRPTRRSHKFKWREPKTRALPKWQVILMLGIFGFLVFVAVELLTG